MEAENTHQVSDGLWSSGQLSERDIDRLPALGIEAVFLRVLAPGKFLSNTPSMNSLPASLVAVMLCLPVILLAVLTRLWIARNRRPDQVENRVLLVTSSITIGSMLVVALSTGQQMLSGEVPVSGTKILILSSSVRSLGINGAQLLQIRRRGGWR